MISSNITALLPSPDRKGYVDVYADGELILTLSEDAVFEAGLHIGDTVDDKRLAEIEYRVSVTKAKKKAYDYLSYGDLSRKTLFKKLTGYGISEEIADAVCDDMEKAGYIDDERYAAALCRYLANTKLYGPKRIKQELYVKGISGEIAQNALEELETDFDQNALTLATGKFSRDLTDAKEVSKLVAALLRYGYDYETISSALSQMEVDDDQ